MLNNRKCQKTTTCSVGQKKKKLINSNANYHTEIKLVPVNTDYCLLQFDALKFFLGIRLHGWVWGGVSTFL